MCLIPVDFSFAGLAIYKPYCSDTFHLAPSSFTMRLFQLAPYLNAFASRNDLDVCDLTENLKWHHLSHVYWRIYQLHCTMETLVGWFRSSYLIFRPTIVCTTTDSTMINP